MSKIKRYIFILFRIVISGLTSVAVIFLIFSLNGDDPLQANGLIKKCDSIMFQIHSELGSGIEQRITQLGNVPEKKPYRKFYCIELAKLIHELSRLTLKQRVLFGTYNVRTFEKQVNQLSDYQNNSDVDGLMYELEIVKRELKNSANLIDRKRETLARQRTAYILLFAVLWIAIYQVFTRVTPIRESDA